MAENKLHLEADKEFVEELTSLILAKMRNGNKEPHQGLVDLVQATSEIILFSALLLGEDAATLAEQLYNGALDNLKSNANAIETRVAKTNKKK